MRLQRFCLELFCLLGRLATGFNDSAAVADSGGSTSAGYFLFFEACLWVVRCARVPITPTPAARKRRRNVGHSM